jgi:hypothetical protein
MGIVMFVGFTMFAIAVYVAFAREVKETNVEEDASQ